VSPIANSRQLLTVLITRRSVLARSGSIIAYLSKQKMILRAVCRLLVLTQVFSDSADRALPLRVERSPGMPKECLYRRGNLSLLSARIVTIGE
jgi:hypothetical protein